ncbi:hypothetical protein NC652_038435 [Populus alba x Populus x berolinensis]|nr:hypothetical protein NC652_038435 [Populus alba x Populus x berolinensis]
MRIGFKKKLDYLNDAPNSSILNEKLVKENEILKAQVLDVNPILTKLTKKKENADQLRSNQISLSFLSIYNSCRTNDFHEKYCMHNNI